MAIVSSSENRAENCQKCRHCVNYLLCLIHVQLLPNFLATSNPSSSCWKMRRVCNSGGIVNVVLLLLLRNFSSDIHFLSSLSVVRLRQIYLFDVFHLTFPISSNCAIIRRHCFPQQACANVMAMLTTSTAHNRGLFRILQKLRSTS
jgi:hypothetical protein